ncbi:S8 family peptidase [Aquisphaera insulae]|uniref:S8 family peptidase n=1 Tax=Aquisphaera insulae TaxID=2712864 RepID=UPI0013ECFA3A|nr:S8 family serine peptidase [Aquisphaera insulae]
MAKRPKSSRRPAAASHERDNPPPDFTEASEMQGDRTGRYLVLMREEEIPRAAAVLNDVAGLKNVESVSAFDTNGSFDAEAAEGAGGCVFPRLGVAVVTGDPDQIGALAVESNEDQGILAIEPERIMYALAEAPGLILPAPPADPDLARNAGGGTLPLEVGTATAQYLRGYRDAVVALVDQLLGGGESEAAIAGLEASRERFVDDAVSTWGLKATRVTNSRFSGRGIRVAVLDTGLDLRHPDFSGRTISSRSFVAGQQVQDGHGHGTHCIGTSTGPERPGQVRRYGCAFRAEIFAGKVLSNAGSGADTGILAGIEWALTNGCRVISMSLGAPVQPDEPFSPIYENVGRRALRAGALIVAAAGNDSRNPATGVRLEPPRPVGRPANCPSIMAVGALDRVLAVGSFSNGGLNPNGGGVDIAGPGVDVFSSWPMPTRYRTISGTSMATPHVAGIAAMWSEAQGATGAALWQLMTGSARRLRLSARDVGSGLVQAP